MFHMTHHTLHVTVSGGLCGEIPYLADSSRRLKVYGPGQITRETVVEDGFGR